MQALPSSCQHQLKNISVLHEASSMQNQQIDNFTSVRLTWQQMQFFQSQRIVILLFHLITIEEKSHRIRWHDVIVPTIEMCSMFNVQWTESNYILLIKYHGSKQQSRYLH